MGDTGGTFKSDTPGTFVSDIGGTFEVILSFSYCVYYFTSIISSLPCRDSVAFDNDLNAG